MKHIIGVLLTYQSLFILPCLAMVAPSAPEVKNISLCGELVTLRTITQTNTAGIRVTMTPKVCQALGLSALDAQGLGITLLILKQEHDMRKGTCLAYTIHDAKTKEIIGILSQYLHRPSASYAQVSGWIRDDYWEQGHYQEAMQLALTYLFKEHPDITTCIAKIKKQHTTGLDIYKAAGFVQDEQLNTGDSITLVYTKQHVGITP